MAAYWRYAIDLFPFQKSWVPVARFSCRHKRATFSLLPVQLIPYFQYTVDAVIGTLLLALRFRQDGQRGFYGASVEVDAESDVTPWLVACWLSVVAGGFRRAHAELGRLYDVGQVRSAEGWGALWSEVRTYLIAFARGSPPEGPQVVMVPVRRYALATGRFLIGTPSQSRRRRGV